MMSTVAQGETRAYLWVPAGDVCLSKQAYFYFLMIDIVVRS